jgi:ERCC4-type nuclease
MTNKILIDLQYTELLKTFDEAGFRDLIEVIDAKIVDVEMGISACEIKRVTCSSNDIWSSVKDGRFDDQAISMGLNFEHPCFIFEIQDKKNLYVYADTPEHSFTPEKFESLCLTMSWDFKCPVYITESPKETMELILKLWKKDQTGPKVVTPTNKEPKPRTLRDQQIYWLSGFYDMGDKKTEEILTIFKQPFKILKWILETQLTYTKNNTIKGTTSTIPGYGPKFFQKNQELLLTEVKNNGKKEPETSTNE